MRQVVKFKLKVDGQQKERAESWRSMLRGFRNYCLADRIDSYAQSFAEGPFCYLRSHGEAEPLTCSVSRSASIGNPWRGERVAQKGKRKGELLPPDKRSAYNMQAEYMTQMRKNRPWYLDVNYDVQQQSLRNLDRAFQNFFNGKADFPQFKKTSDIDSFEFKTGSVNFNESSRQVFIPSFGWVGYFKSRDLGSGYKVKTSWMKIEADGLYIVSNLDYSDVPDYPQKTDGELKTVNGLDRGIKKIIAGADGEVTPNPQIGKRFERRLEIRQRRLSRKKKGSKNRRKASKKVARVHQKIKRVREDFQWKLAKKEAVKADVTGLEDLNIRGMKARCKPKWNEEKGRYDRNNQTAKSALNKAIADASWYSFELKLEHQARKLGNRVVKVHAHGSSQECSQCHYVSPKNRDKEKFVCENCGHHDDADIDAGVVIAQRTIEKLGLDTLAVVSRKVTPAPESTGDPREELSLRLLGEPGNQTEEVEQLSLFRDLFGESPGIAQSA